MECSVKEEIINWWDGVGFFIKVHNAQFKLSRALFAKNMEADDKYMLLIAEFMAPPKEPGHKMRKCTLLRAPEVPSSMRECAMAERMHGTWPGTYPKGKGKGRQETGALEPHVAQSALSCGTWSSQPASSSKPTGSSQPAWPSQPAWSSQPARSFQPAGSSQPAVSSQDVPPPDAPNSWYDGRHCPPPPPQGWKGAYSWAKDTSGKWLDVEPRRWAPEAPDASGWKKEGDW